MAGWLAEGRELHRQGDGVGSVLLGVHCYACELSAARFTQAIGLLEVVLIQAAPNKRESQARRTEEKA